MGAYEVLLKAVQAKGVFERNRIRLETKVLAYLLYMAGLSYRAMTLFLELFAFWYNHFRSKLA